MVDYLCESYETNFGSSHQEVFCKKVFLKILQNSQGNKCAIVSFLIKLQAKACNFIKKKTDTGVFLWILRNFSENVFFAEHLLVAASEILNYH